MITTLPGTQAKVSDPDAILEALIEAASAPSLSTLFQRAKDLGLIKAMSNYGERASS